MASRGMLGEIVARKQRDVADRLRGVAIDTLRERAQPTQRSLRRVLARPGARFILEVKRVSPSEGRLRADADPAAMARAYAGAADAISVLTDEPYFGGSLSDLAEVRQVFDGPILAKDFIVDPRQVPEARLHGADAVLAILAMLSDAEAGAIIGEARRFGMDVLVEAHDEAEVRRVVELGAAIIGINNRNLDTLAVDLSVTTRLAGLVPPDRLVVCESGIADRSDVNRLSAHADAFLVGSSLMRAADPRAAARALVFGRVKICGLTNGQDVRAAIAAGASHVGLVMVPESPRSVGPTSARRLSEIARESGVPVVAVFRDEELETAAMRAGEVGAYAVQLHGREDRDYITALRKRLCDDCEIWATSAVERTGAPPRPGADRTVFDTSIAGVCGGTGKAFDWSRLHGRADLGRGILAGGLHPGNAGLAGRVGAFALDVGSGVEAIPGRKDERKLNAFFEALRPSSRREQLSC